MKTIFWNVDTQYDFMRNDNSFRGALSVEGARVIEPNLEKLTKIAEKYNIQVINTADWHNQDSKEISDKPDFKKTYPAHCMQNTKGAEYIPSTAPHDPLVISWEDAGFDREAAKGARNIVLYKDKFDVFEGNPHTLNVLQAIAPDRVFLYGVATNVCVDQAVLGLAERVKEVYVVRDAIKELPKEIAEKPLEAVLKGWNELDIRFVDTGEVERYLRR